MSWNKSRRKSSGKKAENVTFLKIPKGDNMQLRFGYSDYGGIHRLDIRQWVMNEDSGKMIPTKAGLSIPISDIDSFMNALQKAIPQVLAHVEKKTQKDLTYFEGFTDSEEVSTLRKEDLEGDDQWG